MKRLWVVRPAFWFLGALLVTGLLAGCRPQAEPTPAVVVVATPNATATTRPASPSSTPSATPPPTATPTATATATPTATPTSTPTLPPQAIQLTTGGCCTQPYWSADGQQVRFIDKPDPQSPVGIWGVAVAEPLAPPALVSERIEESLARNGYLVETDGNATFIERLADGERWQAPAQGRSVIISPQQTRIAWSITNDSQPAENQVTQIWIANLDGSDARRVATLPRGGLAGWVSEEALLVSGRDSLQAREQWLQTLSLEGGSTRELARAERLRGASLSPSGEWVVYFITFGAEPAQNGLWLARTDGSEQRRLDGGLFGAYQWRGCVGGCAAGQDRLVMIPFRPDAEWHQLMEIDASTGEVQPLTDPSLTRIKIANGDWRLSPDGRRLVFVESRDKNIWMIELPEG